ncbi:hypothetical protein [Candidatus Similichlamydia laticola]|uniref:Uncharacterized protein n=1 Tax=Candidatus Similichlamydia laticola TaxID=2170265 RepID=A0A369KF27_9BACT|nr:hypothetical protein [Candidatus Similichlamydia laticola]RDB31497.1 hypothetical protein HAT2_00371 [Candidatus Similichlamydia laticola]
MFSSRRLLYRMFYATLGCAMLMTSLHGREVKTRRFKLTEPQGKVQNVLSQLSWLNLNETQDMDLLKEICRALEAGKALCLMVDPGVFDFSEKELEWVWKHFFVLPISDRDIKVLVSFRPQEEDNSAAPSICLIKMEASRTGSAVRIVSAESFSNREVHELYSRGILIEEMNLFLRGAPLQDLASPIPVNDLSEGGKEEQFRPEKKEVISFREIQLPPSSPTKRAL